jgi:preprotein translocase subunit SecF
MLTDSENRFIVHWEKVRIPYSSTSSKFRRGLPMALIFGGSLFLSLVGVYFLSPEWYTKISQRANSSVFAIIIGLFLSILFFAYFKMHFKWEMDEQMFNELKAKQKKYLETTTFFDRMQSSGIGEFSELTEEDKKRLENYLKEKNKKNEN